jgi:poly(hydroxyalkanoate) depolymerase family esterase
MNPNFTHLMNQATHLVRSGKLQDATAAIQAALRGAGAVPGQHDEVAPGRAFVPARDTAPDVIDVEARVVDVPRPTARPAAEPIAEPADHPAVEPDTGTTPQGVFVAGRHTSAAGTREYKLYIPPAGKGRRGQPLVVMLHGCTQDPDDFAAGTRMNEAAQQRGHFVLYPAQAQSANPSRCWNWFKHNHQGRGRGEPALLAAMVAEVVAEHAIDASRVYVAGLSAGGAMAAILGDAYPDVFAAVGVHSGLPTGSATDVNSAFAAMQGGGSVAGSPTPRPPTIVFHGDQDSTVHPVNGERVATAHGPQDEPQTERVQGDNGRAYTQHTWRDTQGRVVAEHWVVHGSGHAWSGGSPSGSYTDPKGPSATDEMLRFFAGCTLQMAR